MMVTMASRMMHAVWFLVFLVVVSLVVLSYYAENDKAYPTAQLPSTRTDGTSGSSSSSESSPSASSTVALVSLLALLGMVTLIASVATLTKRHWMQLAMEGSDSLTADWLREKWTPDS